MAGFLGTLGRGALFGGGIGLLSTGDFQSTIGGAAIGAVGFAGLSAGLKKIPAKYSVPGAISSGFGKINAPRMQKAFDPSIAGSFGSGINKWGHRSLAYLGAGSAALIGSNAIQSNRGFI